MLRPASPGALRYDIGWQSPAGERRSLGSRTEGSSGLCGTRNLGRRLTRGFQSADRSRRSSTVGRSKTALGDRQSNPTATSHPDPDEATSSLDAGSEQQLLSGLRRILPGTTIVVISHRVSALYGVDRVIVLEAGRVVEDDVPTALLENSGAYSRLFSAGALPCTLASES